MKRFCFGLVQAGVFAVLGPACNVGAKLIYNAMNSGRLDARIELQRTEIRF